jgi:hypothetical protein
MTNHFAPSSKSLIVGIKTLIAIRTLREKTAGDFITPQVFNLDTKVNEPLLLVSLFTQKCGLLKEKSSKKENSSNNSNIYN